MQAAIAGSDRVRAFDGGHSFNRIADTDGTRVTVSALQHGIQIDPTTRPVPVSVGLTYAQSAAPP